MFEVPEFDFQFPDVGLDIPGVVSSPPPTVHHPTPECVVPAPPGGDVFIILDPVTTAKAVSYANEYCIWTLTHRQIPSLKSQVGSIEWRYAAFIRRLQDGSPNIPAALEHIRTILESVSLDNEDLCQSKLQELCGIGGGGAPTTTTGDGKERRTRKKFSPPASEDRRQHVVFHKVSTDSGVKTTTTTDPRVGCALEKAHHFVDWVKRNQRYPSQVIDARLSAEERKNQPTDRQEEHRLAIWFCNLVKSRGGVGTMRWYPEVERFLTTSLGEHWYISPISAPHRVALKYIATIEAWAATHPGVPITSENLLSASKSNSLVRMARWWTRSRSGETPFSDVNERIRNLTS